MVRRVSVVISVKCCFASSFLCVDPVVINVYIAFTMHDNIDNSERINGRKYRLRVLRGLFWQGPLLFLVEQGTPALLHSAFIVHTLSLSCAHCSSFGGAACVLS